MSPGYKTTEFWHALIAQIIAALALTGAVSQADTKPLETALGQCVTGIFAMIINGVIVFNYIRGRNDLKLVTAKDSKSFSAPAVLPFLVGALALFSLAGPAQAQSIFPWRSGIQQQMKEHDRQIQSLLNKQQAPAPAAPSAPSAPQIIVIPPASPVPGPIAMNPLQQFPIQGQPKQEFPIQGQPKQDFPIQGQPKQDFPIQGQPRQDFPIQGQPLQPLPIQGHPQLLPIQAPGQPPQPPVQVMPPATSQSPQSYSRQHALSHPIP